MTVFVFLGSPLKLDGSLVSSLSCENVKSLSLKRSAFRSGFDLMTILRVVDVPMIASNVRNCNQRRTKRRRKKSWINLWHCFLTCLEEDTVDGIDFWLLSLKAHLNKSASQQHSRRKTTILFWYISIRQIHVVFSRAQVFPLTNEPRCENNENFHGLLIS